MYVKPEMTAVAWAFVALQGVGVCVMMLLAFQAGGVKRLLQNYGESIELLFQKHSETTGAVETLRIEQARQSERLKAQARGHSS